MRQASILGWVKAKPQPVKRPTRTIPERAYIFTIDLPEGLMLPGGKIFAPVKAGDMVSENALPGEVWGVLLRRGAVVPYRI